MNKDGSIPTDDDKSSATHTIQCKNEEQKQTGIFMNRCSKELRGMLQHLQGMASGTQMRGTKKWLHHEPD